MDDLYLWYDFYQESRNKLPPQHHQKINDWISETECNMEKKYVEQQVDIFVPSLEKDIMIIYNDTDLTNELIKKKLTEIHSNFCIHFGIDKIIIELIESFNKNKTNDLIKNIEDQIKVDFSRMEIFINTIKCTDLYSFKEQINKYKKYYFYHTYDLYNLILMFTTQAPFFYPYKVIYDIYTTDKSDMHIVQESDWPHISIIEQNEHIEIILKKIFKHINVDNKTINKRFHTLMVFKINLREGYYYIFSNHAIIESCIMYWFQEKSQQFIDQK